jgi:hypothetical protein
MEEIGSEAPTRVLVAAKMTKGSRGRKATEQPAETAAERSDAAEEAPSGSDWLSEVDSRGETLDWPERPEALKLLDRRPAERDAARKRVRHLFPRPETTEWRVAELQYDRRRRARA